MCILKEFPTCVKLEDLDIGDLIMFLGLLIDPPSGEPAMTTD